MNTRGQQWRRSSKRVFLSVVIAALANTLALNSAAVADAPGGLAGAQLTTDKKIDIDTFNKYLGIVGYPISKGESRAAIVDRLVEKGVKKANAQAWVDLVRIDNKQQITRAVLYYNAPERLIYDGTYYAPDIIGQSLPSMIKELTTSTVWGFPGITLGEVEEWITKIAKTDNVEQAKILASYIAHEDDRYIGGVQSQSYYLAHVDEYKERLIDQFRFTPAEADAGVAAAVAINFDYPKALSAFLDKLDPGETTTKPVKCSTSPKTIETGLEATGGSVSPSKSKEILTVTCKNLKPNTPIRSDNHPALEQVWDGKPVVSDANGVAVLKFRPKYHIFHGSQFGTIEYLFDCDGTFWPPGPIGFGEIKHEDLCYAKPAGIFTYANTVDGVRLELTKVTLTPAHPKPGDRVTVSTTIKNVGTKTIESVSPFITEHIMQNGKEINKDFYYDPADKKCDMRKVPPGKTQHCDIKIKLSNKKNIVYHYLNIDVEDNGRSSRGSIQNEVITISGSPQYYTGPGRAWVMTDYQAKYQLSAHYAAYGFGSSFGYDRSQMSWDRGWGAYLYYLNAGGGLVNAGSGDSGWRKAK